MRLQAEFAAQQSGQESEQAGLGLSHRREVLIFFNRQGCFVESCSLWPWASFVFGNSSIPWDCAIRSLCPLRPCFIFSPKKDDHFKHSWGQGNLPNYTCSVRLLGVRKRGGARPDSFLAPFALESIFVKR